MPVCKCAVLTNIGVVWGKIRVRIEKYTTSVSNKPVPLQAKKGHTINAGCGNESSECEFDWAEVKIMVDGKYRCYYLAVFTSANSIYRYALLFQRQDSLAYKDLPSIF